MKRNGGETLKLQLYKTTGNFPFSYIGHTEKAETGLGKTFGTFVYKLNQLRYRKCH